jgi:acetylornithine/succinyldiaminopimelate/putrescine aminotransferase
MVIVPEILVLGKALGGGMPLGGFIANKQLMDAFTDNPVLGHITTFGGHPVCCAAGKAAMTVLLEEQLIDQVKVKEQLFLSLLQHPKIKTIRSRGLMMAVELEDAATLQCVIQRCIENGVFVDWFLFAPHCIRIAPPLNISEEAIREAGEVRFLPIILTTFTAIGGLIPIAISTNPLISPLAIVMIGGLISSTLLSRIITPVVYKLIPPRV